VHLARPLGLADRGVRVGLGGERLEQQLDLWIRFP
jgi:hypothetical protein